MSLFTLAGRAVQADRRALQAKGALRGGVSRDLPPVGTREAVEARVIAPENRAVEPPPAVSTALQRLVDFIPTETITLYWLAVPASRSLYAYINHVAEPVSHTAYDWWMLGGLIVMTPLLLILSYLSGLASHHLARPPVRSWPWWKALAATIAFGCWAFAVPGNPFLQNSTSLMVMWFVATVVSTILGLIDPIIMQWYRN